MKIIYGITKSNFGGAQRYVYELAVEAKKLGHEVKVVCGQGKVLIDKLGEADIEVIPLLSMGRDVDVFADIKSGIELVKILREEKPDVFHINSTKMGGVGSFAARLARVPKIIFTSHGWAFNETWRPKWQIALIKFFSWGMVMLAHTTICVSGKTKRDIENWPLISKKLVVVHNGIKEFDLLPSEQARRELGVHESDLLHVGTIGELHKVKGHDVLLHAWEQFARGRHAQLTIIGDGEERQNLEELARELGISNSVRFTGLIDDARKLLPAFDIYVFPSRSENLPYAILEAGYAALPVIASSVGGIPEVIETGTSGILVPPEFPDQILSSLILLHGNPDLCTSLGSTLQEVVKKKFSFDKMASETLAFY